MNNIKYNILISVGVVLVCAIITITNGVNFFLLFIPVVFIVVIVWFSSLLRKRFGSSYGAAALLFLVCVVPIAWYIFSANLPMTYLMTLDRKKNEDLLSFKNYSGGVDAKKEVANYQLRQDSILRQTVTQLLSENLVDSALNLIRKNQLVTEKIKKVIFTADSLVKIKVERTANLEPVTNTTFNGNQPCGNYPESSTRYLTLNDIAGKSKRTLRLMRNEIYMRHNYIFTSEDLTNYAQSFACYKPINSNVDSQLSNIELSNIRLLLQQEGEMERVVPGALSLLLPIAVPVYSVAAENILMLWDKYIKDKKTL